MFAPRCACYNDYNAGYNQRGDVDAIAFMCREVAACSAVRCAFHAVAIALRNGPNASDALYGAKDSHGYAS